MLRRDYEGQECAIAATLEVIGERWTLLILRDILRGNRRFDQLQEGLGLARNVLSNRLARLTDEGIVERRAYQERPQRFEYFLTEKGLDLWPVLVAMLGWGDKHVFGSDGGPVVMIHRDCGGRINDRRICEDCGEWLEVRDARAVRARTPTPA
jgi:DNA-binding HxlR family transcriptional regulator